MGPLTDIAAEESEMLARLEELMLPHVACVGLAAARAAVIQDALAPLCEEDIRMWTHFFAAVTLWDGGTVGQALREARRVRAILRRPEPPAAEEVDARTRQMLRLETHGLVADWLGALEAASEDGTLSRASLDAAMLPPLPPAVGAAFGQQCAARMLGADGAREALILGRMSLEDPDLCMPHDAAAILRLRGVVLVP
ncbi:MAG: hypothetical protein RL272_725 [Candidatus Parcubacteria bacterium]|jgi:hypothetical protein